MIDSQVLFPIPTGGRNADDMGLPGPSKENRVSDTPRTDPTKVIADLIALAQALQFALDDSEEIEEGCYLIDAEHIKSLTAVIDRLDALPDDKPGYTMNFPGKAQWALRDLARLTEERDLHKGLRELGWSDKDCPVCGADLAGKMSPEAKAVSERLERLTEENEALRKDAERITWYELNPQKVKFAMSYRDAESHQGSKGSWSFEDANRFHHDAPSLRAAIDAAIKEGSNADPL